MLWKGCRFFGIIIKEKATRGIRIMVIPQLSKLLPRVRFPYPAPTGQSMLRLPRPESFQAAAASALLSLIPNFPNQNQRLKIWEPSRGATDLTLCRGYPLQKFYEQNCFTKSLIVSRCCLLFYWRNRALFWFNYFSVVCGRPLRAISGFCHSLRLFNFNSVFIGGST